MQGSLPFSCSKGNQQTAPPSAERHDADTDARRLTMAHFVVVVGHSFGGDDAAAGFAPFDDLTNHSLHGVHCCSVLRAVCA